MKLNTLTVAHSAPLADMPFIIFLGEVDRLLYDQYGIGADDLDAVAVAQENGDTPQAHVDWIADHYGLVAIADIGYG